MPEQQQQYRAAVIGCSRMGAFIDNEIPLKQVTIEGMEQGEAISTLGIPMRLKPPSMLPYGHSPAYEACDRTMLVAGCDLRPEIRAQWSKRFGVPLTSVYADYKEMLRKERPEIVSVCTQPEHRAAIIIYAVEHGAKAIYAEKALCASVEEAEAIHACLRAHNVHLNMGTNRRYDNGYEVARQKIWSGDLGALKTIVMHSTGPLFNGASHCLDVANILNNDSPPVWVQGDLEDGAAEVTLADGSRRPMLDYNAGTDSANLLRGDVKGTGTFRCENGVTVHMLNTGRGMEVEAICERGVLAGLNDGETWELREPRGIHSIDPKFRATLGMSQLDRNPTPLPYTARSSSLQCVEDLVRSLDSGERATPPRGGPHGLVALRNIHLTFGFVESYANGGAKVQLPLANHGGWVLAREGLLAADRRLPSFERRESLKAADEATEDQLAMAAGVLETAEVATARL